MPKVTWRHLKTSLEDVCTSVLVNSGKSSGSESSLKEISLSHAKYAAVVRHKDAFYGSFTL